MKLRKFASKTILLAAVTIKCGHRVECGNQKQCEHVYEWHIHIEELSQIMGKKPFDKDAALLKVTMLTRFGIKYAEDEHSKKIIRDVADALKIICEPVDEFEIGPFVGT